MSQQGSFTVGTSKFNTLLRRKHLLVVFSKALLGFLSAQTICIYLFIFGMADADIYDIRLFNFTVVNNNDFYIR